MDYTGRLGPMRGMIIIAAMERIRRLDRDHQLRFHYNNSMRVVGYYDWFGRFHAVGYYDRFGWFHRYY